MRVLLIGGSGLVGRALAARLSSRPELQLDLLLRRVASGVSPGARVFAAEPLSEALQQWQSAGQGCDVFISALGTTRSIAGSIDAFARVDRDLVLLMAKAARAAGAQQAILVSSVGADPRSRNDYLRIKGQVEAAVANLGFERCDFLQPGLLLGEREGQPARPAERLGQRLAPLFNALLIGRLARYRAIEAGTVAAAASALIGRRGSGICRHQGPALQALAGGG
ncbi:NAD(P)H-binding protein [Aquimonas voraii]|uniref:NAD(P)H-binding n=1 Tax=Aquimonas voraii TaxID=265719 RepID=A0A1G6SGH1_9GAMM|nr:NAD(P)H-binding protein [Aquimonas voraii]SDD16020.1 NAD(P)H-binding [Aquimonas voraii]